MTQLCDDTAGEDSAYYLFLNANNDDSPHTVTILKIEMSIKTTWRLQYNTINCNLYNKHIKIPMINHIIIEYLIFSYFTGQRHF